MQAFKLNSRECRNPSGQRQMIHCARDLTLAPEFLKA